MITAIAASSITFDILAFHKYKNFHHRYAGLKLIAQKDPK
jgi:hypothetical protein